MIASTGRSPVLTHAGGSDTIARLAAEIGQPRAHALDRFPHPHLEAF
jgi:hypothetical protein